MGDADIPHEFSIRGAVESWVAAYLSGDPVNLQQTVGDGNVTHHYTPLAGLAQPQSDGVAVSTCAIPDPKDTGTMIAAVHVSEHGDVVVTLAARCLVATDLCHM